MRSPKTILIILFLLIPLFGFGQETIFNGFKKNEKKADQYYLSEKYQKAYQYYLEAYNTAKGSTRLPLKIAQTCTELKQYSESVDWFELYISQGNTLKEGEALVYAQNLQRVANYDLAIEQYKVILESDPGNKQLIERIWRLTNIDYLLEDSVFYNVQPLNFNTSRSEYGAVFYKEGVVFISDKKSIGGISSLDGYNGGSYKTMYKAKHLSSNEKEIFTRDLHSKYNIGHPSFYQDESKMVYSKNGTWDKNNGSTLGLFFAKNEDGKWKEVKDFKYNSPEYSISHPFITEDGSTLYFASDRPGGYGDKDIYVSYLTNGDWSEPENLGKRINTSGKELYPHVNGKFLYFSSDGHSGFGGLDIFKVSLEESSTFEIINPGYPINTSSDDFGIYLNQNGTKGLISSNRRNGGFDDDVFEIEIDLQTYPLSISGKIKYKELEWKNTEKFEILSNAKLFLIDVQRGVSVGETESDEYGNFTIDVPYSSKYSIKVIEESIGEIVVSFEIPKNKKKGDTHDIVLVKNGNVESQNREQWEE